MQISSAPHLGTFSSCEVPSYRRSIRRSTLRRARFLTAAVGTGLLGTAAAVEVATRATDTHHAAIAASLSGAAWVIVLTVAIWRRSAGTPQLLALLCFAAAIGEVFCLSETLLTLPGFHFWRFMWVVTGGQFLAGLLLLSSRTIRRLTSRGCYLRY